MSRTAIRLVLLVVVAAGVGAYFYLHRAPAALVLTGIVTTDDVIVSSEVQGRLQELLAREGDAVKQGQILGQRLPEGLVQPLGPESSLQVLNFVGVLANNH